MPERSDGQPTTPGPPIYVAGLDRSGKTTMSGYLATHSRIAIPGVGSNMETYFYGQYGDLADPANLERCLAAMMSYKHVVYLEPDLERIRAEFTAGPRTYERLFSLFLIHFAEREGKPRWGAQTGLVERYADRLFDAYDGLRIVHMVRDPRDRYLASIEAWPEGRLRAGGAVARWRYSTGLAERHAARYPDGYLIVRFEDLVERTEETLRTVCAFVGEEFEPAMSTMDGAPVLRDRLAGGAERPPGDLLSAEHIGAFRERLPVEDRRFIQQFTGAMMERHGYEPERLPSSPGERLRYAFVHVPDQLARAMVWRGVEEVQQRFPRHLGRTPGRRMIVKPS